MTEPLKDRDTGMAQPALVNGTQSALETMLRIVSRVLKSYQSGAEAQLSEHLQALKELRQVDRLLVLLSSSAGALDEAAIFPIGWALLMARPCLQAFLLRRVFDAGKAAGAGIDPNDVDVTDMQIPSTLKSREVRASRENLHAIRADIKAALDRYSPSLPPRSKAWEASLRRSFGALTSTCRTVLRDLGQFVEHPDEAADSDSLTTTDLWKLDTTGSAICNQIMADLGYELCSLQTIRRDDVIETIAGEGDLRQLVGLSKHRLVEEESLRDIQADIVLRERAEVIRGNDVRFDKFIYERYGHDKLVRAFVPLVIFRDSFGKVCPPPPEWDCWTIDPDPAEPHGKLVLSLNPPPGMDADVIGTVEAGFRFSRLRDTIDVDSALALAREVNQHAPRVHAQSLEHALERVVEALRDKAGSDSAALHFADEGFTPALRRHFFLARSGHDGRVMRDKHKGNAGAIGAAPRADGLGMQALRRRQFKKWSNEELHRKNPHIYEDDKVRTLVAFPLFLGAHKAIVYAHYLLDGATPDADALESTARLAEHYGSVIGAAFDHADARDRSEQMAARHRALTSLLNRREYRTRGQIASAMAWSARNLLAADVVTLHEYDDKKKKFRPKPPLAGQLKSASAIGGKVRSDDVRWKILKANRPIFPNDPQVSLLEGSKFSIREGIVSVAALPLRAGDERVGLLFVSFRYQHVFSEAEKGFIRDLAETYGALLGLYKQERPRKISGSAVPESPPGDITKARGFVTKALRNLTPTN